MRKIAVLLSVGLLAAVASAAPLEFFFSLQGHVGNIPNEWNDQTTLTIDPGDTVYLWARTGKTPPYTPVWDRWVSVNPVFGLYQGGQYVCGGPGIVTGGYAYNVQDDDGNMRWEPGSDFDPVPDAELKLVAVVTKGMGRWGTDPMTITVGDYRYNLVAELQFADRGYFYDVYMSMGNVKHVEWQDHADESLYDQIYYGFGDDPLWNYAQYVCVPSGLPDLHVTPEPASLVLLALAGLALRRR